MEQSTKTIIVFFVLVLLIVGLYVFSGWFSRTTGYILGEDEKIVLAQCLTGKKSVFYISSTCPSCEKQINAFGENAARFLEVVSCETPEKCPDGGVPAWKINKEIYYGQKKLQDLIELSGCEVDTD